jgi:serine/threonine protein kinase
MKSLPYYCSYCGAAHENMQTHCLVCAHPLTQENEQPFLLNKRYRILSLLGRGGFGAVYKVQDTHDVQAIRAIKQINLAGLSAQQMIEATETFHREVHLLTSLEHPNLPHIYDHFTDPEHWYLVMDFIDGETLEAYLATRSTRQPYTQTPLLPLDEVIAIGIQLCTVLEYLHTHQPPIIFRDLKPANVMRTTRGHLYLIDFGIARYFKPGQEKDTAPLGSPGYAAPEQYGKTQTTPRSDIYSLGALLHQLLSGNDPSETPFQFASLRLSETERFSELTTMIERMLQIQVEKRPEQMSDVKRVLQHLHELHELPQQQKPQQPQMARVPFTPSRRSFTRNMGLGIAALIGTGSLGYVLYQRLQANSMQVQSEPPTPPRMTPTITSQTSPNVSPSMGTSTITKAAWSPDGQKVAYQAWDIPGVLYTRNRLENTIYTYQDRGTVFSWSPDSVSIASNSNDHTTVVIWDWRNSAPSYEYPVYNQYDTERITSISWSPDKKRILVGGQTSCHVIDLDTREVTVIADHLPTRNPKYAPVLLWSPDSSRFAISIPQPTNVPDIVQIWDVKTKHPLIRYKGNRNSVRILAWSPNGEHLVMSDEEATHTSGTIRVWSIGHPYGDPAYATDLFFSSAHVDCFAWMHDSSRFAFSPAAFDPKNIEVDDVGTSDTTGPDHTVLRPSSATNHGSPLAIMWTQDNQSLLTIDKEGYVDVWPFSNRKNESAS